MEIKIGNTMVGDGHPPYLLAEIGINHDGNFDCAKAMIKAAAGKCNGVKFQMFRAEQLFNRDYLPDEFDRFKKLEFDFSWWHELRGVAKECNLDFIVTPFDLNSLNFCVELGVPAIKISSGDLTYTPLLEAAGKTGLPIIMSTGMGSFTEIADAILHYTGLQNTILLHCVSNYPTQSEDANLNRIKFMKDRLPALVGYSDHTFGFMACAYAVVVGACLIEKHYTLDNELEHGDHPHSVTPSDLLLLKSAINDAWQSLRVKDDIPADKDKRATTRRNPSDWLRPLERGES